MQEFIQMAISNIIYQYTTLFLSSLIYSPAPNLLLFSFATLTNTLLPSPIHSKTKWFIISLGAINAYQINYVFHTKRVVEQYYIFNLFCYLSALLPYLYVVGWQVIEDGRVRL